MLEEALDSQSRINMPTDLKQIKFTTSSSVVQKATAIFPSLDLRKSPCLKQAGETSAGVPFARTSLHDFPLSWKQVLESETSTHK